MLDLGFDDRGRLRRSDGAAFDPWSWDWEAMPGAPPTAGLSARAALERLAAARALRPVPVGVIGPRSASAAQAETARALGAALARMGLPVLCGGRTGVMEAVAEGVRAA